MLASEPALIPGVYDGPGHQSRPDARLGGGGFDDKDGTAERFQEFGSQPAINILDGVGISPRMLADGPDSEVIGLRESAGLGEGLGMDPHCWLLDDVGSLPYLSSPTSPCIDSSQCVHVTPSYVRNQEFMRHS